MNSSTHTWPNGVVVTAEKNSNFINLRIQGEDEKMLCDIEMGIMEALSTASVLLSVVTKLDSTEGKW